MIVGIYYFLMGIDGFSKKIPLPSPSEKGRQFLLVMEDSKYILFTVKILEILVGLAWIQGRFTGLAWIIFTPIWFNILAYHLFINKKEIVLPILLGISHLLLAIKNAPFLMKIIHLESL